MSWTEADLASVEAAIRERLDPKSPVQLTSLERSERYRDTPLPDLMKLRDEMKEEIKIAAGTPRRRVLRTRTSKGL